MADIFVSYSREERGLVQGLSTHLARLGWSVWWDRHILAGTDYDNVIEREIDCAKCIIVLWSPNSITSRWVKTEAGEGLKRGVLIPVSIGDVTPPLAFRNIQAVEFGSEPLLPASESFGNLLNALEAVLGPPPGAAPAAVPPTRESQKAKPHTEKAPGPVPKPHPLADSNRNRMLWIGLGGGAAILALAALLYQAQDKSQPGEIRSKVVSSTPPTPVGSTSPDPTSIPPAPPNKPPAPTSTPPQGEISDKQINEFVRDYIAAANTRDVDRMVDLYAARVNYFDKGIVDLKFIRDAKTDLYERWERVDIQRIGAITVRDTEDSTRKIIQFRFSYHYSSPSSFDSTRGTLGYEMHVVLHDGELWIVDQQEIQSRDDRS